METGFELTVTEMTGGGTPIGEGIEFLETEWYPGIVVKIEKQEGAHLQFGPMFNWVIELQGEGYQVEINDKKSQYQVRGSTSLICSKNQETGKMSKFYEWYSRILGAEPATGHKISTKDLIGKPCYVMLKQAKDKIHWNIFMVKGVAKKAAPMQSVKSVVKGKPATAVVESSDVESSLEEMQAFDTTSATSTVTTSKPDVFKDVF